MLQIIEYVKTRYFSSQKAQGMVEYALILAFVVAIAAALSNDGGIKGAIEYVITSVTTALTGTNTTT